MCYMNRQNRSVEMLRHNCTATNAASTKAITCQVLMGKIPEGHSKTSYANMGHLTGLRLTATGCRLVSIPYSKRQSDNTMLLHTDLPYTDQMKTWLKGPSAKSKRRTTGSRRRQIYRINYGTTPLIMLSKRQL